LFLRPKPWPRWAELNEAVEELMDFQITKVSFISISINRLENNSIQQIPF